MDTMSWNHFNAAFRNPYARRTILIAAGFFIACFLAPNNPDRHKKAPSGGALCKGQN